MIRLPSFRIPNELYAKGFLFREFEGSALTVPDGVREIGSYGFTGSELESITLPSSLQKIGECAFYKCSKLKRVVIPDGVLEIGKSAFSFCSSLEEIVIPESVKQLAEDAFYRCSSLESVWIPGGTALVENPKWITDLNFRRGDTDDSGFIRIVTTKDSPAARYATERSIPLIIEPNCGY